MKYIKLFESHRDSNNLEYISNNQLSNKFKHYDEVLLRINQLYDNITMTHRGNRFYDIKYKMHGDRTIHIGVYDIVSKQYLLWEFNNTNSYSIHGADTDVPDFIEKHEWKSELDEDSFDVFVNRWYDIYDNL